MTDEQQKFIDMLAPLAKAAQDKTTVPASVTIAQAILETGWGKHTIADANNLFGIKGVGPAGSVTVSTREVVNGQTVFVDAPFRKYHNMEESVEDHANFFLVNKRYAGALKVASDPNAFAEAIHQAGYATDPQYANSLIGLMRDHNLYQYDKGASPMQTTEELNRQEAEKHSGTVPAPAPTPLVLSSGDEGDDPEIQAIIDLVADLTPLDPTSRRRVIEYVASRLNIDLKG